LTQLGCTVTIVHHTGKNPEKGHLGAENIKAALDTVRRVDLMPPLCCFNKAYKTPKQASVAASGFLIAILKYWALSALILLAIFLS
jgi:hypothetical protein